jgi:hypothetical protein
VTDTVCALPLLPPPLPPRPRPPRRSKPARHATPSLLLQQQRLFHSGLDEATAAGDAAATARRPDVFRHARRVRAREERREVLLLSVVAALAAGAVALGLAIGAQYAWQLDATLATVRRIFG